MRLARPKRETSFSTWLCDFLSFCIAHPAYLSSHRLAKSLTGRAAINADRFRIHWTFWLICLLFCSYGRTPPCSAYDSVTLCSEYFHDVQITGLDSGKTYFYQIPSSNGTSTSPVLNFTTSMAAGTKGSFSVAVVNDMGYTNANGTRQNMLNAIESGSRFVWHGEYTPFAPRLHKHDVQVQLRAGGDISYADDW